MITSLNNLMFNNARLKCGLIGLLKHDCYLCCRNRQSGDAKYVAKLSLDELQCFAEQVSNLPCNIREARLIEVHRLTFSYLLFDVKAV